MKFKLALVILFCSFHSYGVQMKKLVPCPNKPNCISSIEKKNNSAYVEPFILLPDITSQTIIHELISMIESFPRTKIIESNNNYIHAEFKTFLGFVDDLEFLLDEESNVLHIRSASRIGYYDFGKNKSRYEEIKRRLKKSNLFRFF